MVLQLSYQLLDNLDEAFVVAITGSDTNPETLAAALTAYSPSVYTDSSSFTSINTTIETLYTLNVSTCTPDSAVHRISHNLPEMPVLCALSSPV